MHSVASGEQTILPSNAGTYSAPQHELDDEDETFADLAIGVAALALLATSLTIIGHHFGGPVPRLTFWRTFGPLLLLPLMILIGVSLAPGGLLIGQRATLRRRGAVAFAGLGMFLLVLVFLNGPSILLLSH
jgi:hypothetical protein